MPDYVLEFLITFASPVIAALGAWVAAELIRLLRAKVKNEVLVGALERAVHIVEAAVGDVEQTFVKEAKARAGDTDGLTHDDAAKALQRAYINAKSYLGPRGIAELQQVIGNGTEEDIRDYLVTLIEARIAKAKGML